VGYGLMMDAGSTGSRVHVYRWVWKDADALPTITDDFFKQVKPGLSALASNAEEAAASLQPLLDFALEVMPPEAVSQTWVRLYATAGLRLLPISVQELLLAATRRRLAASPFVFENNWVGIADGITEAVDAWVRCGPSALHHTPHTLHPRHHRRCRKQSLLRRCLWVGRERWGVETTFGLR
jgi:Golgi nucleoside diphosphatase